MQVTQSSGNWALKRNLPPIGYCILNIQYSLHFAHLFAFFLKNYSFGSFFYIINNLSEPKLKNTLLYTFCLTFILSLYKVPKKSLLDAHGFFFFPAAIAPLSLFVCFTHSATCRRPIKGAAGRPFSAKDYKIEDGYTSKYVSKYQPVLGEKVTKPKTGRSIPMWIKILIFVVLAVFLFLVYQVMETNEGNPFANLLQGGQSSNKVEN